MHRNHELFKRAVAEGRKIKLKFFSAEDGSEITKICIPIFYSPPKEKEGRVGLYHFWNISSWSGNYPFHLPADRIIDIKLASDFATSDTET